MACTCLGRHRFRGTVFVGGERQKDWIPRHICCSEILRRDTERDKYLHGQSKIYDRGRWGVVALTFTAAKLQFQNMCGLTVLY